MRTFVAVGALALAMLAVPLTAEAATTSQTVSFGAHGAARLTSGSTNSVYVNLKGLANGRWAEALYVGTCASLGARIVALPALMVTSGTATRTNPVTAGVATAGRTGVIRIAMTGQTLCAPFAPSTASPSPTTSPGASGGIDPSTILDAASPADPGVTEITPDFDAPAEWHVTFGFSCAKYGVNDLGVDVYLYRGAAIEGDIVKIAVATSASVTVNVASAGRFHLEVLSVSCTWNAHIGAGFSESAPLPVASSSSSGATAICNDGTISYSNNRSGTCSGHGGVRTWL